MCLGGFGGRGREIEKDHGQFLPLGGTCVFLSVNVLWRGRRNRRFTVRETKWSQDERLPIYVVDFMDI